MCGYIILGLGPPPPSTHPPRPLVERSNSKHSTNAGNTLATKQQLLPLGNQICPPYINTSVLRTRTLASTCPTPKLNSQTRSPETGNHNNDPLTVIIQETALLSRPSSRKSCARERGEDLSGGSELCIITSCTLVVCEALALMLRFRSYRLKAGR